MIENIRIQTLADLPAAIDALLGFRPTESLVVMGNGQGPTARVDLGPGAVEALAPAVRHWRDVLLLVYSEAPMALLYLAEFTAAYPEVNVLDALDVKGDTVTSLHSGETVTVAPIAPGILGDRIVAPSREDLIAEAQGVTDAAVAESLAEGYYASGDGARAWIYVDRARELGGDPTWIEGQMMNAVNPRGEA